MRLTSVSLFGGWLGQYDQEDEPVCDCFTTSLMIFSLALFLKLAAFQETGAQLVIFFFVCAERPGSNRLALLSL